MALNEGMTSKFGVTYQPGQIIFLEYEPGTVFSDPVRKGQDYQGCQGQGKLLDILEPGDVFGEMAISKMRTQCFGGCGR